MRVHTSVLWLISASDVIGRFFDFANFPNCPTYNQAVDRGESSAKGSTDIPIRSNPEISCWTAVRGYRSLQPPLPSSHVPTYSQSSSCVLF